MNPQKPSRVRNLSITGIAALTGCITLIVIAVALFAGLWLDSLIGRRGLFTIGLLILSVPISLYLMTRVALALIKQLPPPPASPRQRKISTHDEKED